MVSSKLITTTKYYDEFLRYYNMAKVQQEECNLGVISHENTSVNDDLMKHVHLFDVVERKFAGFSQIVNDVFYGWSDEHPYWHQMQLGRTSKQREYVAKNWTGKRKSFGLPEWLYLFLLHRLTGSGINYAQKPSGYHNTLLFHLHECDTIGQMVEIVKTYPNSFYTSVGYQFPSFPKPTEGYKRGGDYFLCEFAPQLAVDVAKFLETGGKKNLREVGDFMFKWNKDRGLRAYKFQYAAFIADIADWFPEFVNRASSFYYGTNAVECLNYLAIKPKMKGMSPTDFLDSITLKIYEDTGAYPYNSEDVACDMIRWVENYCKVGSDYNHLDLDSVWNSSTILDHPYGRQKAMLELGLIKSFNDLKSHPSDDKIIKEAGLNEDLYKQKVKQHYGI
jgi:hypothetical protein